MCVSGVLTPSHVAALRARTDSCMRSALALDQHQGAKGAWRYMFSTGEKTGTCMHYPVRPKRRRFPTPETLRASRKSLFTLFRPAFPFSRKSLSFFSQQQQAP